MARGLNSVVLVGTLTQAPDLKYTPGGLAILELNLAGNDRVHTHEGEEKDLAWYHRVTVFGKQAETLAADMSITAGTPMFVEGALNYRTWEGQDGQRKNALDVKALRAEVLSFEPRKGEATVTDTKGQHRLVDALNEVRLIGNLTRDAELRYTPSGAAVTRFSLAINERFRDRSGADQEKTHYVDVSVWRDLAEGSAELGKGDPVFVTGRLMNEAWTDQEGNKRYATRVEGHRVEMLVSGRPNGGAAAATPAAQAGKKSAADMASQLDLDEEFPQEADLPF